MFTLVKVGQFLLSKSSHRLCVIQICSSSNHVPSSPQWKEVNSADLSPKRVLSHQEVAHLESISLVQYKNTAIEKSRLEDMIRFADSLQVLNTNSVEPMFYVHEDSCLYLRQDKVTDKGCAKSILKNAKIAEEDYFVAPPGNVSFYESQNNNVNNAKSKQTSS